MAQDINEILEASKADQGRKEAPGQVYAQVRAAQIVSFPKVGADPDVRVPRPGCAVDSRQLFDGPPWRRVQLVSAGWTGTFSGGFLVGYPLRVDESESLDYRRVGQTAAFAHSLKAQFSA